MSWRTDTKPDANYAPVERRRNLDGKLPPETPCPELETLEKSLGSLAVTTAAVLAGCGIYQLDARSTVSFAQFETESESMESRSRMLLLHGTLSQHQRERLDAVKKTMSHLSVAAHSSIHLNDVVSYASSPEERVWASTYLNPGVSATIELGMRLADAINKNDPIIARECVAYMKKVDEAVARAYPPANAIQARSARQLSRAALLSLLVIRDSFGTIAALRVFANTAN